MIMLTKEEVLALQPSDTEYFVELWRLWDPAPHLIWSGKSKLYVQRAPAYRKLPERLACISPKAYDWAEGSAHSVENDGSIVVEDYEMKIYRLEEAEEPVSAQKNIFTNAASASEESVHAQENLYNKSESLKKLAQLYRDDRPDTNGICTLCGDKGIIDYISTAVSQSGIHVGRLNYCICEKGHSLREQGVDMRTWLNKENNEAQEAQDRAQYEEYVDTPDYLAKLEIIREFGSLDTDSIGFHDSCELGAYELAQVCEATIRKLQPGINNGDVCVTHHGIEFSRWYTSGGRYYSACTIEEEEDEPLCLCSYHQDSLGWDACSDGFDGCQVEEARERAKWRESTAPNEKG